MNMTTSHRVPGQSTASHPLLYGHLPHSLLGLLEPFPGSEGVRLLQGPLLCLPPFLGPSHYVNITMFEEGFLQFYYDMIDQEFLKIPCNLTSLENFLPQVGEKNGLHVSNKNLQINFQSQSLLEDMLILAIQFWSEVEWLRAQLVSSRVLEPGFLVQSWALLFQAL